MATFIKRPVGLTATPENDGVTAISFLTAASLSDAKEIAEVMVGNSNFPLVFTGGKRDVMLSVTTTDFAVYDDLQIGQQYSDVELTASGYSCGSNASSNATFTLSYATLTEKSELAFTTEGATPITYSVTFKLTKDCSSNSEPTLTVS